MKTIEVSDYLYTLLKEESSRRIEEGWKEGVCVDRVACESIAFFFGHDKMSSYFDLDGIKDAFRDRPLRDIDQELRDGIAAVEESNEEYELRMGMR